jgi:hypothetical protein
MNGGKKDWNQQIDYLYSGFYGVYQMSPSNPTYFPLGTYN